MEASWREHLSPDGPGRMRITKHGRMLTDAVLVSDEAHMSGHSDDRSPAQLVNTAGLPGIVGDAWAMADWHFGYGFPIGGVVATDIEWGEQGGSISPGGVGFDINCGVRLCSTGLNIEDINPKLLAEKLSNNIPAGATRKGGFHLDNTELDSILSGGASAAMDLGLAEERDLANIESNGFLESENWDVGHKAMKRGSTSLGTLGSGNHFLELQVVDRVVDEKAADAFGLRVGQITAMIHSGSRGLGHQVCSEHVAIIEKEYSKTGDSWFSEKWGFSVPDRQLASAPFHSPEGASYFDAMCAAGNFAFANRSALTQKLRDVLREEYSRDGEMELVYDVSHNIAKIENHVIHGKNCTCAVHRKGATRALGGDNPELSSKFSLGQPVLVPGDMGTASWVLAGPVKGGNDAFSSSCHGAGRRLSRTAARKSVDSESLIADLESRGVHVRAKTPNVLSEEAPDAYKNVDEVISLTNQAGLARPVARLRPISVIKG
tara:strand:+ start:8628 stop:10097 length:1470 start_codon:yes stop_codon:yes gene_type:complete